MSVIMAIGCTAWREIARKKDGYVFLLLLAVLAAYTARMPVLGQQAGERFVKEIGLGLIYLFTVLLSVPFAARQLSGEIRDKTIYPLLAKPVSRRQCVLGKFAGALLVSVSVYTVFFAVFLLSARPPDLLRCWVVYAQAYWCGALLFVLLNALTICLSLWMTYAATLTTVWAIYCLMSWFSIELRHFFYAFSLPGTGLYYLLPHVELLDLRHRLVHEWPALPVSIMALLSVYVFCYSAGLLTVATRRFSRMWL